MNLTQLLKMKAFHNFYFMSKETILLCHNHLQKLHCWRFPQTLNFTSNLKRRCHSTTHNHSENFCQSLPKRMKCAFEVIWCDVEVVLKRKWQLTTRKLSQTTSAFQTKLFQLFFKVQHLTSFYFKPLLSQVTSHHITSKALPTSFVLAISY